MSTTPISDPPHLAAPFQFAANGAVTVPQDSAEEIAACVYNIVVCPIGSRADDPTFGVDEVLFGSQPLNVDGLIAQAEALEPRAQISAQYVDTFERQATGIGGFGVVSVPGRSDINLLVAPISDGTVSGA